MIASYPSLQSLPFEPTPGYFAPIREVKANFPWQSKILSIIAAIGFVMVATLNTLVTAPLKAIYISKPNNFLQECIKNIINKKDALQFKRKRFNYRILEELIKPERKKIENLIYQRDILSGSASPFELRSSMRKIFNGISDFVVLPRKFWEDFLGDVFSENSTAIQNGLNEIDEILGDSEKFQNLVNQYEESIRKKLPEYQKLKLLNSQLEAKLSALKQQLASNNNSGLQNQINELEKDISSRLNEMNRLISKDDMKALESWQYYKNKHFVTEVKRQLMKRKAFLQSIKSKKNLYVEKVNSSTPWSKKTKIAVSTAAAIGAVGLGWYTYNYGAPLKTAAIALSSITLEKIRTTTNNTWENLTWENLTWENIKSTASSLKESINLEDLTSKAQSAIKFLEEKFYLNLSQ